MKISNIVIHNYRSVRHCELKCPEMLVMLGQNNHGKSNILSALEFALTSIKPDTSDLFAFAEDDDNKIWVELTFHELTDQERKTLEKYIQSNGSFSYRKTAIMTEDGKIEIMFNGYVEEPEQEWLKSDNVSDYTSREKVRNTPLSDYVPNSGRLTKADIEKAQKQYIEAHRDELTLYRTLEMGPLLGQKNVAAGILPDFFLVPAIRDLNEESKTKSTALFGKLLNLAVTEMASADPRFREVQNQMGLLIGALNSSSGNEERPSQLIELENLIEQELLDWNVRVSVEVTPPDISQIFELGTEIHLDDGLKTVAQRKGHGLQRAVIFGLMKAWAKAMRRERVDDGSTSPRKASESMIFAIEEPELFLHPHAQRSLDTALRVLAESHNSQVIVCSHSTHFVNLDDYKGIALVRKRDARYGTEIVQCTRDLFEGENSDDRKRRFHMAAWINPDRGEMLFANRVVFVEGETEKTIFPYLGKKLKCYSEGVSVIDCGSKHNLPLYITIAKAFDLNYIVVHDKDPIPDFFPNNWNEDKIREKKKTFQLNEIIATTAGAYDRILVLCPDFEGCSGVPRAQAYKKGKALAAIDYFENISPQDISPELVSIVRTIYDNAVGGSIDNE